MPNDQEVVEVCIDINSQDLKSIQSALYTLKLCNEKIVKLENSRFYRSYSGREFEVLLKFKEGMKVVNRKNIDNGSITISLMGEIESLIPDFEQDDIDAFALTYRQMIQNNDSISVKRLADDIYYSSWMFEAATENFKHLRQGLNDYFKNGITLQFGENRTISRRHLIDIILYGGLAHTNHKKEKIFRSWMESGFDGILWADFIASLLGVMGYLVTIKKINTRIIDIFEPYIGQIQKEMATIKS